VSPDAVSEPRAFHLDELDDALRSERELVEAALVRSIGSLADDLGDLLPAVEYAVLGGGKRIRPILCVAAFRAAGGSADAPIHDLAASVELIHAYSLMHDDLPCMDDAALRRGKATSHLEFGEEATMVAGAALIPAAALQAWTGSRALGLDDDRARRITVELLEAAGARGMVGGQALDLMAEERELDVEEVADLHAMKTGALLSAAPAMGGLAAGGDERVVEAFRTYGKELGLAFQIADDVLDATSSAAALGKEPSDEVLAKSTYVSRLGVDEARERARSRSEAAREALEGAGLASPLLDNLAGYVVRRRM